MPKLSYPTSSGIGLPVLVDASQLQRLDEIIDEHLDGMRAERDRQLEAAVDADIAQDVHRGFILLEQVAEKRPERLKLAKARSAWAEERRSITISLSKGRQIEIARFAEALSHPPSQDEIPLDYTLNCRVGPIAVYVDFSGNWDEGLTIKVSPSDSEKSQEIFGALVNWLRDVQAPRWQQLWYKARFAVGFLLFMFVVTAFFLVPFANWDAASHNAIKAEARKLLAKGVDSSNQQRALELLLEIESDYSPTGAQKPPLGIRYWSYVGVILAFLIILFESPKRVLGFWKGRELLKLWRFWIKTVAVTVPTLLITFLLIPWLLYWFHLAPPSP